MSKEITYLKPGKVAELGDYLGPATRNKPVVPDGHVLAGVINDVDITIAIDLTEDPELYEKLLLGISEGSMAVFKLYQLNLRLMEECTLFPRRTKGQDGSISTHYGVDG